MKDYDFIELVSAAMILSAVLFGLWISDGVRQNTEDKIAQAITPDR